ncbi:hypothetical protein CPB83DRAFT_821098 [Crepidotus variabilis]|uniref:Peptide hydrolase n=1 Tax=Crepidotus variabilis TaxID=179855 RepID=A0A9P6JJY4_9AGAR|nr:hypothetical protein CPB83DRAFT_821098 [Crepidotus variabilis]
MVFHYFHQVLPTFSFSFKRAPVSILLSLVVGFIFTEVLLSNTVPAIPEDTKTSGLDLDGAYFDLHQITRQPHAINSHANDIVRSYILNKLRDIVDGYPYASIVDDNVSNASYASYKRGVSFEGSNILVKIEGTEPDFANRGGVLLSAHFDSVSTGPGVTDDAIGVATLISLVKYLTTHRPRRTAVFNINNGEEDGLNGAHAFLQHPWAKIPDTFINLEGASAGGRPLLFRGSSATPARSFKNPAISYPHGNVLSADAFATGIIKSNTDYAIYSIGTSTGDGQDDDTAVKPMEGIDFAFYQGRSKYHTKYDSISGANGAKESLWLMMETTQGAAMSLLNDDELHEKDGKGPPPVYFDVLGSTFIVLTQQTLLAFNLVLLILGPILLFVIYHLPHLSTQSTNNSPSPSNGSLSRRLGSIQNSVTDLRWTKPAWWHEQWRLRRTTLHQNATVAWRWGKFWVMLVVGTVLNVVLVLSFIKVNPFIVYSRPYLVLTALLSLSFLNAVVILNAPAAPSSTAQPDQQKLTVMLQLYILSWLVLVGSTTLLHRANVGGFYFFSAWNAFLFLGCVSAPFERFLQKTHTVANLKGGVTLGPEEPVGSTSGALSNGAGDEDVTERTPLLHEDGPHRSIFEEHNRKHLESESGSNGWWILQLLLIVPTPMLLVSQVMVLFIDALYQTLSDGGPAVVVYAPMSLLSFILVLMVTPFAVKMHTFLTSIVTLAFVISASFCWIAFPFSQDAPLVVFFQQNVTVDLTNPFAQPQALTTLSGVPQFLESQIIPSIPSSWGKDIQCSDTQFPRAGLRSCSWSSDLHPAPTKYSTSEGAAKWITASATRLSPNSALISVKGVNTRSCRMFFDTPIVDFIIHESLEDGSTVRSNQPRQENWSIPDEGVKSLWMMSRTWDKDFAVEVMWDASAAVHEEAGSRAGRADSKFLDIKENSPFSGLVGCAWAEYESATIGLGLPENSTGIIPAYEEVLTYLPRWAVSTKLLEALVTVMGKFEV